MAEEGEDLKPKIDLTIKYEGQSQHSLLSLLCGVRVEWSTYVGRLIFLAACQVKVKPTTPLKKVFEAAEVRALEPIANTTFDRPN